VGNDYEGEKGGGLNAILPKGVAGERETRSLGSGCPTYFLTVAKKGKGRRRIPNLAETRLSAATEWGLRGGNFNEGETECMLRRKEKKGALPEGC